MADRSRLATGGAGEWRAALEYRRLAFEVLATNWRCRGGEIDLIVHRDDLVVFVEVKTRRRASYGGALGAVGHAQQARIRTAAQRWLVDHPEHQGDRFRFDVVTVVAGRVEVVDGAF